MTYKWKYLFSAVQYQYLWVVSLTTLWISAFFFYKVIVTQLTNKFPAFYGSETFIKMCMRTSHCIVEHFVICFSLYRVHCWGSPLLIRYASRSWVFLHGTFDLLFIFWKNACTCPKLEFTCSRLCYSVQPRCDPTERTSVALAIWSERFPVPIFAGLLEILT